MELVQLDGVEHCVGRADVRLAAVVQQISRGRRAVIGSARRVCAFHVLHLADTTRAFFKMTCWGDDLPRLPLQDHAPDDTLLRVGDIALFTGIQIKAFRGNVEAHYSRTTSRVQLLYRRDRYFNTRDVRLTALYPMIEWYKRHRREFFLIGEPGNSESQGGVTDIGGVDTASDRTAKPTRIRDLREHMVATVLCYVRELTPSELPLVKDAQLGCQPHPAGVAATDFDGALLRELVMQDSRRDWMVVNLWDQLAESTCVTRLLAHRGVVELRGVVVSLNALTNRLLADTTPHTQIRLIDAAEAAVRADVQAVARRVGRCLPIQPTTREQCMYASLDTLKQVVATDTETDGIVVVGNVRIERICFASFMGDNARVRAPFTPRLVASYCSVCSDVLPELKPEAIAPQYGTCRKRCRPRRGTAERLWRYRPVDMVLRDIDGHSLQMPVESDAMQQLLGNISAEMLATPSSSDEKLPFDVKSAVATLLNALIDSSAQLFRAEVHVVRVESQSGCGGSGDSQWSRSNSMNSIGAMSQDTRLQLPPSQSQRVNLSLASLVVANVGLP